MSLVMLIFIIWPLVSYLHHVQIAHLRWISYWLLVDAWKCLLCHYQGPCLLSPSVSVLASLWAKSHLVKMCYFPPPQYLTFLENLLLGFTNKHFQRNYFILRLTAQLLIVWLPMVQCLHTICPWHCFSIFPKLYVCFLFQKSNNTVVTLFWYLKLSPDVAIFYMRLSHYEALLI